MQGKAKSSIARGQRGEPLPGGLPSGTTTGKAPSAIESNYGLDPAAKTKSKAKTNKPPERVTGKVPAAQPRTTGTKGADAVPAHRGRSTKTTSTILCVDEPRGTWTTGEYWHPGGDNITNTSSPMLCFATETAEATPDDNGLGGGPTKTPATDSVSVTGGRATTARSTDLASAPRAQPLAAPAARTKPTVPRATDLASAARRATGLQVSTYTPATDSVSVASGRTTTARLTDYASAPRVKALAAPAARTKTTVPRAADPASAARRATGPHVPTNTPATDSVSVARGRDTTARMTDAASAPRAKLPAAPARDPVPAAKANPTATPGLSSGGRGPKPTAALATEQVPAARTKPTVVRAADLASASRLDTGPRADPPPTKSRHITTKLVKNLKNALVKGNYDKATSVLARLEATSWKPGPTLSLLLAPWQAATTAPSSGDPCALVAPLPSPGTPAIMGALTSSEGTTGTPNPEGPPPPPQGPATPTPPVSSTAPTTPAARLLHGPQHPGSHNGHLLLYPGGATGPQSPAVDYGDYKGPAVPARLLPHAH